MPLLRRALLGLVVAACWGGASGAEPYVSYDNFNIDGINPNKWVQGDRARSVKNNVLRLYQRDFGSTAGDTGTTGNSWGVNVSRPGPVTQLRGVIKVIGYDLIGCGSNPSATRVRARVLGTFFNTGNRVAGSLTGDVLAQVFVQRASDSADGAGVLQVGGGVVLCTNSDCSTSQQIGSASGLGSVSVGETVTLAVEWDRPTRTFTFSRNNGQATSQVTYPNHLFDGLEPGSTLKSVGTRTDVAACASGARAFGAIEATYDTVSVNKKGRP